ncbi:MAG: condensation domain-containing protein, partial [Acidobacteriota bacterium]|nr:condensation domain-containing protein [Acidobacteriota bacterium]
QDTDHVLLLTIHHIVFDRWSTGILLRELASLHEAFSRGDSNPLPELPIQYGDFAQWERTRLSGSILEGLLSYWKGRLANAPALVLPTDYRKVNRQPVRPGQHRFSFSAQMESGLAALSRSENVSLFMALLAGYSALLSTRTRQTDMVIASEVANRSRIETEPLIGFFVNLLVLRTDLSGNPPFRELLARVRRVAVEAYRHQDLPFARLVREIRPLRVAGATPLARSLFIVNAPLRPVRCGGTTFEPLDLGDDAARYDLSLSVEPGGDGLSGTWKYDGNLFDERSIAGLTRDYEELLNQVVKDPEIRLETLAAVFDARRD